jgi:ABC-type sugar transport system ATPase subunit
MAEIRLERVTKEFGGGVRAVDDVTLLIEDGEFMVLVGRRAAASRRSCV